jgi:hypothetical protein
MGIKVAEEERETNLPSGCSAAPAADRRPCEFTLRGLVLTILVCAIIVGGFVRWDDVGVLVAYAIVTVGLIAYGAWRRNLLMSFVGIGLMICSCCLFNPDRDSRTYARLFSCKNNLRNIVLALQQYHDTYGSFPPAYVADENGTPMHSWRVLILPFLDEKQLYGQYSFSEPWNGLNNRRLHGEIVKAYVCPAHVEKRTLSETSYVAVIGAGTMWPGNAATRFSEVKDGTANTIMVVEVHNSGIHWMEPRDLELAKMPVQINPPTGTGISSAHIVKRKGGAQVGFVDGGTRWLDNRVSNEQLRAMFSRDAGDKVDLPPR